ncbi:hypothetical protein [Bifidobacterium simiarum]|uniref:hypothetical protein n=1 Tax=Bifidobacterium simiarum TaxID=2045441 RepID=UPI001BDD9983|nr:hypothetical protein [Bifidobacterium simiarum]MBT1165726.1 hypothetical protein [Bifidobacterium simiarum]
MMPHEMNTGRPSRHTDRRAGRRKNRRKDRHMDRREYRTVRMAMDSRYRNLLLVSILPVMLAAKLMVAYLLPPKYFYDNNRILGMANGDARTEAWGGSYEVAAGLFRSVNVLGLTGMVEWSLLLGVPLTFVTLALVLRADAPDTLQLLFTLASVGLLNIYIFTIGKDVIQFMFFLAVYLVIAMPFGGPTLKIVLAAAILMGESRVFRPYYVLIAVLVIAVYVTLTLFRSRRALHAGSVAMIIVLMVAEIWLILAVASRVMPAEYQQVMTLRSGYGSVMEGNADSSTFIANRVSGEGLPVFMLNYVINAVRMMVPVELAMRGAYYLPFFVFQTMVTVYLVNLLRQINRINDPALTLALCVFLGYALASFIFEPDFGSWTRHEAATFPILHLLVLNHFQRIPLTAEERMLKRGVA